MGEGRPALRGMATVENEGTMGSSKQQEPFYIPSGRLARLTFCRDQTWSAQILWLEVEFDFRPRIAVPCSDPHGTIQADASPHFLRRGHKLSASREDMRQGDDGAC